MRGVVEGLSPPTREDVGAQTIEQLAAVRAALGYATASAQLGDVEAQVAAHCQGVVFLFQGGDHKGGRQPCGLIVETNNETSSRS